MSRSWNILTSLKNDLDSYLSTQGYSLPWQIERAAIDIARLDERENIAQVFIGLYEQPEDALFTIGGGNVYDVNQAYGVDIYLKLGRDREYDENAERQLLEIKDLIIDWTQQIDAGTVTTDLYTLEYDSTAQIIREDMSVSTTITLGAYRELNDI